MDRSRKVAGVILIIIGLGLLAGWMGHVALTAKDLYAHLRQAQAWAENPPDLEEFPAVEDWLREVHAEVRTLKAEAAPFLALAPYLGWLPRYGGDVEAIPALLDVADGLTEAGVLVTGAFAPALAPDAHVSLEGLVSALVHNREELSRAYEAVERALDARERIRDESLSPRLKAYVSKLDRFLPLLRDGLALAVESSDLLGMEGPRSYLILAQNSDELRATGGFITGVGVITVEEGRVVRLEFKDSYAVDDLSKPYPPPPAPLRLYMLAEIWLFRDSNWSPDFPTSARQAAYLYEYGQGEEVYGVVAVDFWLVKFLMPAFEPLKVPGIDEPVTSQNVMDVMRKARGGPKAGKNAGQWWIRRKWFMEALASALRERLEKGEFDKKALVKGVLRGLEEKHILIYVRNPRVAEILRRRGWDGALKPYEGDYLMVVDSNLGFNKVNPLIEERITYDIDLSSLEAELQVSYRNRSRDAKSGCDPRVRYGATYEEEMHRCYWDYLRVYVPSGAQLMEHTPAPVPEASLYHRRWKVSGIDTLRIGPGEFDRQVFSVYILIPRGAEKAYAFRYRLPPSVMDRKGHICVYELDIQKQPGTVHLPVTVRIKLPGGAEPALIEPAGARVSNGVVEYAFALSSDRSIRVEFDCGGMRK